MFRFTIRDLLWLTVAVAMAVAWGVANQRAMNRENLYKLWAFDIAAGILNDETGKTMTVDHRGVWLVCPQEGTTHHFSFNE